MKTSFCLGGIVIVYWLIKEEIFDGGMKKICLVDLYKIPRSGSVHLEVIRRRGVFISAVAIPSFSRKRDLCLGSGMDCIGGTLI